MRTKRLTAVFLTVSTLLIGVPARQHSHAVGDRPHSHDHAHCGHTEDGQSHQHQHNGVGSSVAHVHVTLFGVDFTLPADSDDDENHDARCTFFGPAPNAIELDQSASDFSAVAEPVFDAGEPLAMVLTFRSIAASAAPLCDTARHERSGVLLI
jgi:hypothetical protein